MPMSETVDPLPILVTSSQCARMYGEGLPEDRISTENGAIITCCKRWPLIIDPQVQGIKWLKQKQEKDGFVPCLLTQKNWIRAMRGGISDGMCVIIENLGEEIDATLDPVLSRAIYKKGRSLVHQVRRRGDELRPGLLALHADATR